MPRQTTKARTRTKTQHEMQTLEDLYIDELRDLYNAERQIIAALPKVIKATQAEALRNGLRHHLAETEEQVRRLEEIFRSQGIKGTGKKCRGMEGVLAEGAEMLEEDAIPAVKDAGIVSACQRVEHYEMAGYGSVIAYAELLGKTRATTLLRETLAEEKRADETLTKASRKINSEALSHAEAESEGDGGTGAR